MVNFFRKKYLDFIFFVAEKGSKAKKKYEINEIFIHKDTRSHYERDKTDLNKI